MYQREIIQYINNQFPFMDELVESEDIFSCYDCENKQYIIEIKSRDKHYDPWIIEKKKFGNLKLKKAPLITTIVLNMWILVMETGYF